jgi:hypothetical protein
VIEKGRSKTASALARAIDPEHFAPAPRSMAKVRAKAPTGYVSEGSRVDPVDLPRATDGRFRRMVAPQELDAPSLGETSAARASRRLARILADDASVTGRAEREGRDGDAAGGRVQGPRL